MLERMIYQPIGVIHTTYTRKETTPIQGCFAPKSRGTVEVYPEYADGLKDIEGFSHLILIYHFHQSEGCQLIAKPFLDKEKKGIFLFAFILA